MIFQLGRAPLVLITILAAFSRVSMASLGGTPDTVDTDRKTIGGTRHVSTAHARYTVHEVSNDGLSVREYVSTDGVVFGLSWVGVTQPDLSSLLGPYFDDFQEASRRIRRVPGRGAFRRTDGSRVTVMKFGHLRGARGRAFATELIPQGVTADEIQ